MSSEIADNLTVSIQGWLRHEDYEVATNLISRDAVSKGLLHTFAGNGANDKVWEARLQSNEEIEYGGLQRVIYTENESERPENGAHPYVTCVCIKTIVSF